MNFYRHNWYYIGGILFVVLAYAMGAFGNMLEPIQVILVYSFMALLVHQFEEYGLPGGFPTIFNVIFNGEEQTPDRYPQNSNLAMIVNVCLAYPLYILPILFPDAIWLGLASIFFGFAQVPGHGIVFNLRLKSFYNPGLAACVFLHLPVGIVYINYIVKHQLATTTDFLFGFIAFIVSMFITVIIPVRTLSTRDNNYPFSAEEMARFGMQEKAKALGTKKASFLFKK